MDWSDLSSSSQGSYSGGNRSMRRPRSSNTTGGTFRGGGGGGYESNSGSYTGGRGGGYKSVSREGGGYGGFGDENNSSRGRGGMRGGISFRGGGNYSSGSEGYEYNRSMGYVSHGSYESNRGVSRGRSTGKGSFDGSCGGSYSSGDYVGGEGFKGGRGSCDSGYDMGLGGGYLGGRGSSMQSRGAGGFRGSRDGIQKYPNDFSRGGRGVMSSGFGSSKEGMEGLSSAKRLRRVGKKREKGRPRGGSSPYGSHSKERGSRGSMNSGIQKVLERDPCAVYLFFEVNINQDVAKEIMAYATTAEEISFGLKCHLKYESEEKAIEMQSKAAEFKFSENKATAHNACQELLSLRRALKEPGLPLKELGLPSVIRGRRKKPRFWTRIKKRKLGILKWKIRKAEKRIAMGYECPSPKKKKDEENEEPEEYNEDDEDDGDYD